MEEYTGNSSFLSFSRSRLGCTAATMRSRSNTPIRASISGHHSSICALWRCTRQPATTMRLIRPAFLSSAAWLISSTDSILEASKKPQVLITTASARPSSIASDGTMWMPSSAKRPSIFSESTRFLGQPRETKATERTMSSFLGAAFDAALAAAFLGATFAAATVLAAGFLAGDFLGAVWVGIRGGIVPAGMDWYPCGHRSPPP